jgi:hypothetical protein
MPCREEDISGAKAKDVIQKARRERILGMVATAWRCFCEEKVNERFEQMDAQLRAFTAKVWAWRQECHALHQQLGALIETLFMPDGATPADWDAVVAGKEFKVNAIYASSNPRWNWPRTIPYLNFIALAYHHFEESSVRYTFMKRYHDVAIEISKRGAEILEETTEGIGGAVPEGAVPVTRVYAEELSPAAVEKQLYSAIVTRLRGQRVLARDWDVHIFADTVFEQIRVDLTDETMQRAIEIMEELAERWHDGNGHNGDSDDEWDLDEVVSPYGTCDSSAYDQLYKELYTNKVLEKVIDSRVICKDNLFFLGMGV